MGADMLLTSLSWDRGQKLDWAAGRTRLARLAKKVFDNEDLPPGTDKKSLLASLDLVKRAVENDHREGVVFQFGHLNILFTGGMSWGDTPSDLYTDINDLITIDNGGVVDAIGFDRDLFNYKEILLKILKAMNDSKQLPCLLHLDSHLDTMLEEMLKYGKKGRRKCTST
jgi:hypothetical protein